MLSKPFKYYFVSIFIIFFILQHFYSPKKAGEEIFHKKFLPADYEMLKRTFPYYKYEIDAYNDAIEELKIIKKKSVLKKSAKNKEADLLEFVGPTNIGGRVVDIEINPQNPNIVYAAAATGGVFKSEDTGKNWYPIFDDQPCLTIGDIGIDPNNTEIIYVGTGEANGGHNNFPGTGVYKSVNGGNNWNFIGLPYTASISSVIVDPSNSQRIFVAAVGSYFYPDQNRGVYLSEDGGETWNKSLFIDDSTGAIDLVINPQNPNILFAAMWKRVRPPIYLENAHFSGKTSGIFRSIDGGINWTKLGSVNGLPNAELTNIGRIGLDISKSNPSVIYALVNDGFIITGLYKSIDNGENWIMTNNNFPESGNFSWYFGQIRINPINPEEIFVLDVPLLKSNSSGYNWDLTYGYNGPEQLHVDHHELEFHPENRNYLLSGNDGGINISEDGGLTWSERVKLPVTQFYEIGLDNQNKDRFYGGTQDNSTVRTIDGEADNWERIFIGDGFYVLVDPRDDEIIFASSQFGNLGKSYDGGQNFIPAVSGINRDDPTNWSTPVIMDPNNPDIMYYGTSRVYRSENAADSWDPVSPVLTDYESGKRLGTITSIAAAPSNSEVILAGTDDSYVWISKDYGATWENISSDLPFRWVTRVAFSPINENEIYVTFSGLKWGDPEPRIFKSNDMGKNWIDISEGLPDAPINALAIDHTNPQKLFVGNDIGVFMSNDDGATWDILDPNLPMVVVNDLKIHSLNNQLVIGTHGRGIYKFTYDNTSSVEYDIQNNFNLEQNYPNPFNSSTWIEYSIPAEVKSEKADMKNAALKVFDILGKEVTILINQKQSPGNYSVEFNADQFPSGIYYYRLSVDNYSKTKKMVLVK